MIYFFSFIRSSEYNLLFHFIKYYLSLDIKPENMLLILHKVDIINFSKSCNLLEKHNINYQVEDQFSAIIKTQHVNNFLRTIPLNSWFIYADLDEFFEYDDKILDFINKLENSNYNCVQGLFHNRIAKNNELKVVDIDKDLFEQYPNIYIDKQNKLTGKLRYDQKKIMLLKKYAPELQYISCHKVNLPIKIYPKLLKVHHFKFTYYTIENVRYKKNIYKQTAKGPIYTNQYNLFIKRGNKYYLKLL